MTDMRSTQIPRWEHARRLTEFRLVSTMPGGQGFEGASVAFIEFDEGDLSGTVPVLLLAAPESVATALAEHGATVCALSPNQLQICGRAGLIAWIETAAGQSIGVWPDDMVGAVARVLH